jgi:hypothetical protein
MSALSKLQVSLPGQSYNTVIGANWHGTVLDMAGGAPAGAHDVAIVVPVPMVGKAPVPHSLSISVSLGNSVTAGPITYRPLTVTGPDGTRVYNLPTDGDLFPHLIPTDTNGQMQSWQPLWPKCRVGDISAFTFTA